MKKETRKKKLVKNDGNFTQTSTAAICRIGGVHGAQSCRERRIECVENRIGRDAHAIVARVAASVGAASEKVEVVVVAVVVLVGAVDAVVGKE